MEQPDLPNMIEQHDVLLRSGMTVRITRQGEQCWIALFSTGADPYPDTEIAADERQMLARELSR